MPPEQPPCQATPLIGEFISEARKNAENLMTDIFICYDVDHDKAIRDQVIRALSRYAKTTWTHDRDIQKGEHYERAIERGIEWADNFVFFISPASVASAYCQQELAHALNYHKRIVPLLIAPTPVSAFPDQLRNLQYIDLTEPADYENKIHEILNLLKQAQDYYKQHKVLLVRALKWQTENYKSSFLLRGHNLENAKTWLHLSAKREQHSPLELHRQLITASESAKGQLGTEVFLSYSRKNSDFARHLNTSLQEAGKTTWFDQESISSGVDFEKEIYKGIDGADNFILVVSPDAVESEYCEREVNYASEKNKRFISVLYREAATQTMPEALLVINWIDFEKTPFEKSFPELIQAIELDRDHAHQHTVLQQRASDWAEHQNSGDFLLNQTACHNAEAWQTQALKENKQPVPTPLQQAFVQESRRAIQKANRRRNMLFGLMGVLTLLAVVASGLAYVKMNEAQRLYQQAFKSSSLTKDEATKVAKEFIEAEKGRVFRDDLKNGHQGPEMVWIPAGQFRMGDIFGKGYENERPVHEVSINRFAIGRYEVTVGEFKQFIEATSYQTEKQLNCRVYKGNRWQEVEEANWRNPSFPNKQEDNQPVVCVSWNDAVAYTKWLSQETGEAYRLPSEAEWEYAARGGKETSYWWGINIGEGWGVCNGCGSEWDFKPTAPVEALFPNSFGLYHITGNVEEWVADPWHDNYQGAPADDQVWETGGSRCLRVVRGGAWSSHLESLLLAHRHFGSWLGYRGASRGFRIVREEKPLIQAEVEAKKPKQNEDQCQVQVFRHPLTEGGYGPEMVVLPAGSFQMGDIQGGGYDNEQPVHEVSVASFAIGRYEVTHEEFVRFLNSVKRRGTKEEPWFSTKTENSSSHITGFVGEFVAEKAYETHPVINVSWYGAVAYTEWLSQQTGQEYRLPTEAQWEYAARAGTGTKYFWGNEIGSNWANCNNSSCGDSFDQTAPVGSFGVNPFGLYDTVGNVWEWTCSEYEDKYRGKELSCLRKNSNNFRVMRGGSGIDNSLDVRAANRYWRDPVGRYDLVGFRVVARTL
ncbi:MAG: SUMF1/EgtB/PvdO family nonheme iron enzyme [Thioploca sp.]|nr:SUMF1/EgtB/PvdO family nonheme iron enzyme [Thioploca sp.]